MNVPFSQSINTISGHQCLLHQSLKSSAIHLKRVVSFTSVTLIYTFNLAHAGWQFGE